MMPRLIRGVARTAVVAGTAAAGSNRVSRRQAYRLADQDRQAYSGSTSHAEAPSSPSRDDKLKQLTELGALRSSGVLTEAELKAQKARILSTSRVAVPGPEP
jgi:hypothetical protein